MHRRRFLIYGICCFALYACFVAVFAGYATHRAKRECLESIDNRLLLAAESLKHMLAPDFHDRAVDEEAIGLEEELRNREVVSTFAFETDFEYVYTLAEKDGKFYFAAPTVTPEEAEERARWYFLPYDDIPEEFEPFLENVLVEVRPRPDAKLLGDHDLPRNLLGLYVGRPLGEQGPDTLHTALPDRILIFRDNLRRCCRTRTELLAQIRVTVLHEIGHHFGLDEDRLEELGYG